MAIGGITSAASEPGADGGAVGSRFELRLVYEAARLYYDDEATQSQIAAQLQVSRPTVSRLISEAKRVGLVQITVHRPEELHAASADASERLRQQLGLRAVELLPGSVADRGAASLASGVERALSRVGLRPGNTVAVSSGRSMHELSMAALSVPPGLNFVPIVGGVSEYEPWFQTNEIVRSFAGSSYGKGHYLFATAMPSAAMHRTLQQDPDFQRVTAMWQQASVALVGIGAPTASRQSISRHVSTTDSALQVSVGDIAMNFYDYDGAAVEFHGSDRMVRIGRQQLAAIPWRIAVATGSVKVRSIIAGAATGMFNVLVTDSATAQQLLRALSIR